MTPQPSPVASMDAQAEPLQLGLLGRRRRGRTPPAILRDTASARSLEAEITVILRARAPRRRDRRGEHVHVDVGRREHHGADLRRRGVAVVGRRAGAGFPASPWCRANGRRCAPASRPASPIRGVRARFPAHRGNTWRSRGHRRSRADPARDGQENTMASPRNEMPSARRTASRRRRLERVLVAVHVNEDVAALARLGGEIGDLAGQHFDAVDAASRRGRRRRARKRLLSGGVSFAWAASVTPPRSGPNHGLARAPETGLRVVATRSVGLVARREASNCGPEAAMPAQPASPSAAARSPDELAQDLSHAAEDRTPPADMTPPALPWRRRGGIRAASWTSPDALAARGKTYL